ncbi:MAG TPA: DciA family protein [Hyphomicrobium sp.]|nr:DciA family protein [Hyphomicrobium sp.]
MLTGNDPLAKRPLPPDRRTKGGSFARAVGSFVPKVAGKAFEKFGFHTAEIMTQWPRIAGAEIAKWTAPERIRWPRIPASAAGSDGGEGAGERPGGTLVLRVEPARALDIEYRAAEVIDRVNRYFGYRAIETLKIIQAPINTPHAGRAGPGSGSSPGCAEQNFQMPRAGSQNAHHPPAALAEVPDEGLKAALMRLWTSVSAKN